MARVAKVFGREGELMLNLYDTFPRNIELSEPLFVRLDGLAVPFFLEYFARRGQRGATVVFTDLNTERRAETLVGCELFLPDMASEVLADDKSADESEVYLDDLVGFNARLKEELQGMVEEFVDGENPLFCLSVGNREVWVPAIGEFIVSIDTDARIVDFDLPEGLLELYLE